MEFLFRPRSSGKRQVKPSQDIVYLEEHLAGDESSDDSEFKVGSDASDDDRSVNSDDDNKSSSSGSSSSSDDDDDQDDDQKNKVNVKKELNTSKSPEKLTEVDPNIIQNALSKLEKVCGCCLGRSSNDANEIVDCDGCGISIHEGCYGISESTSVASEVSAASTEPWFCEPCRSGVDPSVQLNCALCPKLGGVFKQTDDGQWVHLVCALYVPGVSFVDPDNLTSVSLLEIPYADWGRRSCLLCEDNRMSKSGISIPCDAGLCKSFFHATCAQAYGLLSEPNYHQSDPYLAHCRFHSDKTIIKKRKQSYAIHIASAIKNRSDILLRNSRYNKDTFEPINENDSSYEDQRILRKLNRQQISYKRDKSSQGDAVVPSKKRPRLLTTSSSAIRKIEKLGEIKGISIERQRLEEQQILESIEATKRSQPTTSFSVGFVSYYGDREVRIEELKNKLSKLSNEYSNLVKKESELRPKFVECSKTEEVQRKKAIETHKKISLFRDTLSKFTTLPSMNIQTPTKSFNPKSNTPNGKVNFQSPDNRNHMPLKINNCNICSQKHDQHLLVHCDTCQQHYHLGCLSPPLKRMPKKSKLYGWQCSECDKGSDSENEILEYSNMNGGRKRRSAAGRAIVSTLDAYYIEDDPIGKIKKKDKPCKKKKKTSLSNNENHNNSINEFNLEEERNRLIANAASISKKKKKIDKDKKKSKTPSKRSSDVESINNHHTNGTSVIPTIKTEPSEADSISFNNHN